MTLFDSVPTEPTSPTTTPTKTPRRSGGIYAIGGSYGKGITMQRLDTGETLPLGTVVRWITPTRDNQDAVIVSMDTTYHGQRAIDPDTLTVSHFYASRAQEPGPYGNPPRRGIGTFCLTGEVWSESDTEDLSRRFERKQAEDQQERERVAEERAEIETRGKAEFERRRPRWAKAVIVAVEEFNDCDYQTDYFNTKSGRVVFLAWSKHTRNNFKEMRKAAARFKETKHLGPGCDLYTARVVFTQHYPITDCITGEGVGSPWHRDLYKTPEDPDRYDPPAFTTREEAEAFVSSREEPHTVSVDGTVCAFRWQIDKESVENRDNYSMGKGYYLKVGGAYATGWCVKKLNLEYSINYRAAADPEAWSPMDTPTRTGTKTLSNPEDSAGPLTLESYSEKAYVVRGDTRPHSEQLKALGGRFNPRLKGGPGWIFSKKRSGEALTAYICADILGTDAPAKPTPPTGTDDRNERTAGKLRDMADRLQKQIDDKTRPFGPQNHTPKRDRQYAQRLHEGADLERLQQAMRALATCYDANSVPEALKGITTKKALAPLVSTRADTSGGYYSYVPSMEYHDQSPAGKALQALIAEGDQDRLDQVREQQLQQEIDDLRYAKIDGFFPTPEAVVQRMIDKADIPAGARVLEPSAGIGSILDLLPESCDVVAVEINFSLCDILSKKGYSARQGDFLDFNVSDDDRFDRIIMNPPFGRGQDIDHITHAFHQLKPGGRLVALCSPGPLTFHATRKAERFRAFVSAHGYDSPLNPGSFKNAFRPTGVNCHMVVLDKPEDF